MATETRIVRPFPIPAAVDEFINSARLHVGDLTLEPDGRATLDRDEYLNAPLTLSIGGLGGLTTDNLEAVGNGLLDIGVNSDSVLLTVNLYSSFLKISQYLLSGPLSGAASLPAPIGIASAGNRPDALRAPHSGCRVEVALLLAAAREPTLGQPWRTGTWIARSRFNVSCQLEHAGFTPRPMDAEQKALLGLSPNATRYVTLPAGLDPLRDEASPDVLELWVDHDLLGAIAAQPKAALSVALQRQLFVDAFNAVTNIAQRDPNIDELLWADIEDSLLGRLIAGLAGAGGSGVASRRQQLFFMMRDDHAKFMAVVEDHAGLTASLIKAMGD